MKGPSRRGDRGVSDVIGFVLTFTIIISAVSLVYVAGFGTLDDIRADERVNSGERSLRMVAETMEDVHRNDAPSRASQFGIDGGQLDLRESSLRFEIELDNGTARERVVPTNALVYTPSDSDTEIVYEGGAVFRQDRQSSLVRYTPVFSCSDTVTLVSVPHLTGNISVSPAGSMELVGVRGASGPVFPHAAEEGSTGVGSAEVEAVSINVSGTYDSTAWERYLERTDWNENGDTFRCETDQAYVRSATIDLETVF